MDLVGEHRLPRGAKCAHSVICHYENSKLVAYGVPFMRHAEYGGEKDGDDILLAVESESE